MSKPSLIIDLRSDSVSGALVEPKFDQKKRAVCSEFLKTSRREINFQTQFNLERFFGDLVTTLKQVLAELLTDGTRPNNLTCFLAAPFYVSQTRTVKQVQPAAVTATKHLIENLVEADRRQFQATAEPLYREIPNDTHELIERKIMQLKLNRYETNSPFGKKAREIEISHYLSVSSRKVLDRFRELFSVSLPKARPVFHSFSFAFYALARDRLLANQLARQSSENILLLDLSGEMTEISLLAQGILWETVSFPLGRNFLIRRLAHDFKTVPEEALSALRICARGDYNKLSDSRMRAALAAAGADWLAQFKEALATLIEAHLGTNKLLAVGDPEIAPVFLDWIKQESYKDLLISEKGIIPSLLTSQTFSDECHQRRSPANIDLRLLLEVIFYDKLMTLNKYG
ncbi:MAG: hypothetical protein AAB677_01110 [Patescibacteria group bacterium]